MFEVETKFGKKEFDQSMRVQPLLRAMNKYKMFLADSLLSSPLLIGRVKYSQLSQCQTIQGISEVYSVT